MKWLMLCVMAGSVFAEKTRVAELIEELDSDNAKVRDSAELELETWGEAAMEAVEEALRVGSTEVKIRAGRVQQRLLRARVLADGPLEGLRGKRRALEGDDPDLCGLALDQWVRNGPPSPEAVQALLEYPAAVQEAWVCEALSWLLAPRSTHRLAGERVGEIWGRQGPRMTALTDLLGARLRISAKAREILEALGTMRGGPERSSGTLAECRRALWGTGVAILAADDGAEVWLQTHEETLGWWKIWWRDHRADRFLLTRLGILEYPRPDETNLRAWVRGLRSKNPHERSVARRVLADVPAELDEALESMLKEEGVAAGDTPQLLLPRDQGRLLIFANHSAFVMPLRGGRWRRVSGTLALLQAPEVCATGAIAWARATDSEGVVGAWKLDLSGSAEPMPSWDTRADIYPSPDGTRVALMSGDGNEVRSAGFGRIAISRAPNGAGCIVTVADRLPGARGWNEQIRSCTWSPDGRHLFWQSPDDGRIHLLDHTNEDVIVGDEELDLRGAQWSPDGTRIALLCPEGVEGTFQHRVRVLMLDVAARKITSLFQGRVGATLSPPAWSHDSRRIAVVEATDPNSPRILIHGIASGETESMPLIGAHETHGDAAQPSCLWVPSNRVILAMGLRKDDRHFLELHTQRCLHHELPTLDGAWAGPWFFGSHDGRAWVGSAEGPLHEYDTILPRVDRVTLLPPD